MGPFVPDIISANLNYIVALLIGICFGVILEQAGFSSSRKLVGLFYGYDFTVLKVFFTAGIVAMVGVMGLTHFGLLDINLVYINPTFVWSAIIGGIIMGAGFIIGGFCPGTSVCAAAIGKIDAMIFILGALVGVLIFAEGYPLFEPLYKAAYLGNPRIFETLNISQNLFAFLMVSAALIAFYIATLIESKVNKREVVFFKLNRENVLIILSGALLLIFSLWFTDRKADLLNLVSDDNFVKNYPIDEMTPDEFAFRLVCENCERMQIVDFRDKKEYDMWSLPRSIHFTIDNFFEKEPSLLLKSKGTIKVFVANKEITERKAAIIALRLGYKYIKILKGGLEEFNKEILQFEPIAKPQNIDEINLNRFRLQVKDEINRLIKENKPKAPVEKKPKRALGGC